MFDVKNDVKKAKELIKSSNNEKVSFTDRSSLYRCTNEMMNSPIYSSLLSNNEEVLSVIGSGDQILNAILFDSINIDAIDLSVFAKYFLEFKIAAVKALSYGEYIDFFYSKNPFNKKLYDKVMARINFEDVNEFWNSICCTNPLIRKDRLSSSDLYKSNLFDGSKISIENAVKHNPYLDENSFYVLKRKLHNNIRVNYITGDIMKLNSIYSKEYNLINLSNICMYSADYQGLVDKSKYKSFVKNLRLNDDGKVLSYLTRFTSNKRNANNLSAKFYDRYFKDDDSFKIHEIPLKDGSSDALLVYKKKK